MGNDTPLGLSTRRDFVRTAIASAGLLAAGGVRVLGAPKPPGGGSRNLLNIPPAATPNSPLTAAPWVVPLGGGKTTSALAYNRLFPGPTIRASRDGSADITLTNGLSDGTTIHWHGMIVPELADGHPKYLVAPGGTYRYQFPIVQRACLNWYHPHPHMMTGEQVNLGLAGAFIVNDAEEAALGLPSGSYEVPLIIRDANFDRSGNLIYNPRTTGFVGQLSLVNGTLDPKLNVDTALYRFRVLNGSNARIYRLALDNGAPFYLIGNDGGFLEEPGYIGQIELGPAERLDLLVDFRGLPNGTKVMLKCLDAGWNLLQFEVTQQVSVGGQIPATLPSISKLSNPVRTRFFSFDGMSKINGLEYDINRIDFQVPFGQTELWRFTTNGNAPHPVHVHGASFQVQTRTKGRGTVFPWERGWKDTVLLQDQETVEVLIRFGGYRGLYLIHCHKLEHEDMGMMSNFEVV